MHPPAERQAALDLVAAGLDGSEVARQLGVPRRTVRDWRVRGSSVVASCPRCWRRSSLVLFDAADYAQLLEPWQQRQVERAPWAFLRGCIRSDGCVFINRTGRYAYESYDFTNHSRDILDLFAATCAQVGVDVRRYDRRIRIYRRASVALMLEHVGRKR